MCEEDGTQGEEQVLVELLVTDCVFDTLLQGKQAGRVQEAIAQNLEQLGVDGGVY